MGFKIFYSKKCPNCERLLEIIDANDIRDLFDYDCIDGKIDSDWLYRYNFPDSLGFAFISIIPTIFIGRSKIEASDCFDLVKSIIQVKNKGIEEECKEESDSEYDMDENVIRI